MFHDLADAIEETLPRIVAATGTPGVAVALASSTELRGMGAGYADLARRTPMTGNSVGTAGSLSKPLVGLSLMRLAEAGDIDVDGPVAPYLPAGARPANPDATEPVTAGMLTAHIGGYRTDIIDAELTSPRPIAEYVASRHEVGTTPEYGGVCPLYGPPGTYAYSSFGMSVVGCAVETVSGRNYSSFVDSAILEPLGMRGSALPTGLPGRSRWDELVASTDYATGYMGFGPWCVPSPVFHSATYPGAGLITSPVDYARLLQSLLRTANGADGVVSPDGLAAMLRPRVTRSSPVTPDTFAGIGLEISNPDRDGQLWWWGHSAAYPWGYWWDARVYPHLDLVVVAMANKWDMMRLHNPADRNAAGIVAQWAARWAASGPPTRRGAAAPRREAPALTPETSALMGAVAGERSYAALGLTGRFDPGTVKAMAENARPFDGSTPPGPDVDAFADGVEQMAVLAPDPEAIRSYARRQGADAALWALECGATAAELPLPAPVFSAPHK
ncbi:serine hydrolase domain-containing protein [Saccharomonospora cyanea]|uniref:Penicillin-binding protein, beta-lactamase class C n=1 Tax=Saccharomonospora cyanea NA-134 TaxID=882082 RepID=H5XCT8_9PSEU|nr:serine hydrolase domain-containing protein [Saccharomonospora cyanea]EHR62332.1 penicillin-binding protein, beta-lactamase class C [Saccharomonospora cyanea NA-134]